MTKSLLSLQITNNETIKSRIHFKIFPTYMHLKTKRIIIEHLKFRSMLKVGHSFNY